MSLASKSRSSAGFALSIVLWIVAALLLGIAFIMSTSKENVAITKALDVKLKTRLEAESLVEILKYAMLTSDYDSRSIYIKENLPYNFPKHLILDGREYKFNKDITLTLRDTSSMLSVFHPNFDLIALFATDDRELSYSIRDSIWDWIDADNSVRLNGAEEAFYRFNRSANFGPRNYSAVESVDELRLIKGVYDLSEAEWDALRPYLYSDNQTSLNLALLKREYLQKILKLDDSQGRLLQEYRDSDMKKFYTLVNANKNFNNEVMNFSLSFLIDIHLHVKKSLAATKLHTLMGFKSRKIKQISVKKFEVY